MSREQAAVFKKHRFASDHAGDLAWSARISQRALRASPEAAARDIESMFELMDVDRVVWRVLQLPRRYSDLEKAGLLSPDDLRAALRGFIAADVVDIVDDDDAKALLPAEVKRIRTELGGKEWRPAPGGLVPKVYRPDIGISSEGNPVSSEGAVPSSGDQVGTTTSPGATPPRSTPSSPPTPAIPRTPTSPGLQAAAMNPFARTPTSPGMPAPPMSAVARTSTSPGLQAPTTNPFARTSTSPGMQAPTTNPFAGTTTTPGAPPQRSTPSSPPSPPATPGMQAPPAAMQRTSTMPPMPAVSSGPQRPLVPAEKTIKTQLAEAFARMDTLDHYMFLGVPSSADESTIRQAYVGLAREYHPDRIAGTPLTDDTETRGHIEALFRRLSLANKTLTNAEQRQRYDRELKTAGASGATSGANGGAGANARPRRPTEARNAFIMADTYFKKKDFHQAEVHYRQAAMFDGDEPMIAVGLAWCIFLNPEHPEEQRREEAKKRLEEALKRFKSAEAAYKLGRVLRELGDEPGAMKRFEDAVRITPNHTDAQRELRIAEMRKHKGDDEKTDEKASLLGKLFKR